MTQHLSVQQIVYVMLFICQKKYIKKIIAVLWVAVKHKLRKKLIYIVKVKLLILNKLCQVRETMKRMLNVM